MIKKNTKIIFDDGSEEELMGGIPLSKGDYVNFHKENVVESYEVVEKKVDYFEEKEVVNIIYKLKKIS